MRKRMQAGVKDISWSNLTKDFTAVQKKWKTDPLPAIPAMEHNLIAFIEKSLRRMNHKDLNIIPILLTSQFVADKNKVVITSLASIVKINDGTFLLEGEAFSNKLIGWGIENAARLKNAKGGFSGGAVLVSNNPYAIAQKEINLPKGVYNVWMRVYDDGNYPNSYQFIAEINKIKVTVGNIMGQNKWGQSHYSFERCSSFCINARCYLVYKRC
jgi:hypothetical protein